MREEDTVGEGKRGGKGRRKEGRGGGRREETRKQPLSFPQHFCVCVCVCVCMRVHLLGRENQLCDSGVTLV